MSHRSDLENLLEQGRKKIAGASSPSQLEQVRVALLGKKSKLTSVLRGLGKLRAKERPVVGKLANQARNEFEEAIKKRKVELGREAIDLKLKKETVDITLPGKRPLLGKKHIVTQIIDKIIDIFIGLGYNIVEGPEVELDYYNFEALNTPRDHPARSLQDTFYIETTKKITKPGDEVLLRTHTSPVQIRVMESRKPPLYVIAPGIVYRRDVADPTHTAMFHQVEGFAVDTSVTFGDLKGTLEVVARELYGKNRKTRIRPHYFPFTEPSIEMDVSCGACDTRGCRSCGGNGWLEILGAGMIDPAVFSAVGYDPEEVTGFAFGMGPNRMVAQQYGIGDIRVLYENDLRFLAQF